jgi:hypothetical protein
MTAQTIRPSFVALVRSIALIAAVAALFLSFSGDAGAARPSAPRSAALMCQVGGGEYSVDVFGSSTLGDNSSSIGVTCHGGAFDGLYCETSDFSHETACSTNGKPS